MPSNWEVLLHDTFVEELEQLNERLQDELFAHAKLLANYGPHLGRPTVDTLKGSTYFNMKEMRFSWQQEVWRVAFAFDPHRQAILLVGGNKCGVNQSRFYKRLIDIAENRYQEHLHNLNQTNLKE
jgi:hypothetical protein